MAIICCWFSRSRLSRDSAGSKLARLPSGVAWRAPAPRTGSARSRRGSNRTESGARTRTATGRSSVRISPACTPSNAAPTAVPTSTGVMPIRSATAWFTRISSSAVGSLTPL